MTWLASSVLVLVLSTAVFGQMATTTATSTPPYDKSTAEGYREFVIRGLYAVCVHHLNYPANDIPSSDASRLHLWNDEPAAGWPETGWPRTGIPASGDRNVVSSNEERCSLHHYAWKRRNGVDYSDGFTLVGRIPVGGYPNNFPRGHPAYGVLVVTYPEYHPYPEICYSKNPPPGSFTCREVDLPPINVIGPAASRTYTEYFSRPAGYNRYGEKLPEPPPPTTRRPPTTPEPEPETPQETVGNLEVPANGSFQSGIGYVSGWVCEAERIAIVIDGGLHLPPVARNISRGDTEAQCGDTENGFITQWNWNLMGEGTYTAALVVDGKTVQSNTFTVTTLGEEFVRGVERDVEVQDFPAPGETARLRWQEAVQGFVLVPTD